MEDSMERQALGSITLFVVAVHVALIFWAWVGFEKSPPPPKPVKLVAKTIRLNPQPLNRPRRDGMTPIPTESFDDVILNPSEEIALREDEPVAALPKLDKSEVKATAQKEIEIPKKRAPPPPKEENPKPAKKTPPQPKKTKPAAKATSKPAPKPAPKPTQKPIQKPASVNNESSKPASKPAAKPDPKKQALLSEAQKRIANIHSEGGKPAKKGELKVPEYHPQATITTEEGLSGGELSYRDELASRLQLLLKLPETGKVQLKLTLSKTGKFVKLVIVNSQSGLNKQYIEKSLPKLTLPGFGGQFGDAAEYTFLITLTSDL